MCTKGGERCHHLQISICTKGDERCHHHVQMSMCTKGDEKCHHHVQMSMCTKGDDKWLNRASGVVGSIAWFNPTKPGPQPRALWNCVCTVKLLYNGHPFCRGLVAVVDECPLVRGCGKMSTNPRVERSRSFNSYKVGPSIF